MELKDKEDALETLNYLAGGGYNFNRGDGCLIKELSNVISFLYEELSSLNFDLRMADRQIELYRQLELLGETVERLRYDSHSHD